MLCVPLHFHPVAASVGIRELTGAGELAVETTGTADVVRLIGSVLATPGVDPSSLAAPDRDRLLAAIHQISFGPRIESTVHCSRCSHPFDLNFRLDELTIALNRAPSEGVEACGRGVFRTGAGLQFRLPSAAEEMEAATLPPAEAAVALARKCVIDAADFDLADLEGAMEEVAPALDLDLDARCPECGAPQQVHFHMQAYLLTALLGQHPRLLRDVHRIAAAYHWSREEILSLRRSERRELVELIETETTTRRRAHV